MPGMPPRRTARRSARRRLKVSPIESIGQFVAQGSTFDRTFGPRSSVLVEISWRATAFGIGYHPGFTPFRHLGGTVAYRAALIAVAIVSSALLTSCSQSSTPEAARSTPTSTVAATTTSAPDTSPTRAIPAPTTPAATKAAASSSLRKQSCTGALQLLATFRQMGAATGEPFDQDATIAGMIADLKTSDQWKTYDEAQRAEMTAGIRDAATGSCG